MDGYVYFFSIIGFFVFFWAVLIIPMAWVIFHPPKKK